LLSNTFQKRNVSSGAELAIVDPLGLKARCRTLELCPHSSAVFCIGFSDL